MIEVILNASEQLQAPAYRRASASRALSGDDAAF